MSGSLVIVHTHWPIIGLASNRHYTSAKIHARRLLAAERRAYTSAADVARSLAA